MVSPRFITTLMVALLLAGAAASARELGRATVGGRAIAIFERQLGAFEEALRQAREVEQRRMPVARQVPPRRSRGSRGRTGHAGDGAAGGD